MLFFQTHTIEDLETYTQYLVSLQVFNPEGHGPNTTVLVMTDEGGECCHFPYERHIYMTRLHTTNPRTMHECRNCPVSVMCTRAPVTFQITAEKEKPYRAELTIRNWKSKPKPSRKQSKILIHSNIMLPEILRPYFLFAFKSHGRRGALFVL